MLDGMQIIKYSQCVHTFHFTLFIGPINLNCGSLERRVRWRGKLSGLEYHISVDFVGNKFSYSYLLTVPIMEVMGSIWMNKFFYFQFQLISNLILFRKCTQYFERPITMDVQYHHNSTGIRTYRVR